MHTRTHTSTLYIHVCTHVHACHFYANIIWHPFKIILDLTLKLNKLMFKHILVHYLQWNEGLSHYQYLISLWVFQIIHEFHNFCLSLMQSCYLFKRYALPLGMQLVNTNKSCLGHVRLFNICMCYVKQFVSV